MITRVSCRNFKGLDGLALDFAPLTVLCGCNGAGKSSVVQAILLARRAGLRAAQSPGAPAVVPLNTLGEDDDYELALGEAIDVLSHNAARADDERIEITLGLTFRPPAPGKPTFGTPGADDRHCEWTLTADDPSNRHLVVAAHPAEVPESFLATGLGAFAYLGAGRDGPAEHQYLQSNPRETLTLGERGQHLAEVLAAYETATVAARLHHPGTPGLRLLKQAEAWLGVFAPGIQLRVEHARALGVAGMRYRRSGVAAEWLRPANTGFGLSCCLPIVVAALLARPDSLVMIDTPEAHLHPAAQSAMGGFLGRLAAGGVQVVLETHSDHIINGIRLAVVDDTHPLSHDQVIFHHLTASDQGLSNAPITINKRGGLSARPEAFFDQSERDLAAIVRRRWPS